MKLQHYLGGLEGLPEPLSLEKRVFVEEWEKRIFGIHVAMMGLSNHLSSALPAYPIENVPTAFHDEWTWASLRTGAEAMNPFDYFKFRYYEKWLGGITSFFVEQGYVTEEELAAAMASGAVAAESNAASAEVDDQIEQYLRKGDSPRRDVAHPRFAPGDRVRVTDVPAAAHTRLPGYLRSHVGTVERVFDGDYAYFTHTGDGIGDPMPIYIVEFSPTELWGARAEDSPNSVYAELFEAYLQPIEENQ
ncbi:nitrile hydratase subunit beta [Mycobacterium sp. AZCC_0083]|uniref:nitrile hydratase subunit beta n=1 Tax=Mycobacterium sp. AZCC_0083 TaxID=2735882 RepID=UPI0016084097|nr:nitrile hydratase subunit beta [Mycobacterium sp. AZCC_0083]MBB5160732.1 nitrile hydratase [Mycobacterium sp. AZCC_0083]